MAPSRGKPAQTLFDAYDVDAPVVTEVRRLLQNLARQSRQANHRVFLVTSAARGEGKTTTAGLMALVSAQVFRKRTLLIDADLRRPAVHTLLGMTPRPGLFEVMHGKATLESATRATPIPTLWVITSGRPSGPAGDAYRDDAFQALLDEVRPKYEIIFVDSAPLVPVVEPLLMAEHADAILLVTLAGHTPVPMLRRMKQIIAPAAQKIAGVILNNAEEGLPYFYQYKYYGYKQTSLSRQKHDAETTQGEGTNDAPNGAKGGTT
ncbi:MAG TPA: CpsD/CapB family tyrosine-protein kinase [Candidatus Eisenbacteria bacterium]|nr:CpsD/CapB family tyrosine-protein kinase [Candidatus Eisenbacteria bacterium]